MVTKWGLSQRLGPLAYSEEEGEIFLGRSVTQHKSVAEETSHTIDEEIRSIIDRNYERAEKILKENLDIMHAMADALMKYETIDKYQIEDLMNRKPVREPKGWDDTPPSNDDVEIEHWGKGKSSDTSIGDTAEQG
jgi:cell division protease FtsH